MEQDNASENPNQEVQELEPHAVDESIDYEQEPVAQETSDNTSNVGSQDIQIDDIESDNHEPPVQIEIDPPEQDENDIHTDQDPNTSTLIPPSSSHQFATPMKLLPPLKDIESISTPKNFSVAKDPIAVRSSPLEQPKSAQLEALVEAGETLFGSPANNTFFEHPMEENFQDRDSDLEAASTFLGSTPSQIRELLPDLIVKVAQRARQHHSLQLEIMFFKLNQEQINQVQLKKVDQLTLKLEKLTQANDALTTENEKLADSMEQADRDLSLYKHKTGVLSSQVDQLQAQIRESDAKVSVSSGSKDTEILQLNDTISRMTKASVASSQRLSELAKELNDVTNEKFTFKLELNKSNNELSYIKGQKEWYELELRGLQDKYSDLVKKYDAELLRDSNKLSALSARYESVQSLKESLQEEVKDLSIKIETTTAKSFDLEAKLELQTTKFTRELTSKDDVVELLNVQLSEKNDRISQLEEYTESLKESTTDAMSRLEKDIYDKEEQVASLQERLRRTEEALDSELHKETALPKLTESAELIMQSNPKGISLSALYAEFNHVRKELALEKSQKESLALQLQHFIDELESKKPAIANYKEQIQFYEQSVKEALANVESIRLEKAESYKECNRLRTRLTSYEAETASVKQLAKDLGRQLCHYLIHSKIRDSDENPLTASERKIIDQILAKSGNDDVSIETDTDKLITDRLVGFANIVELQKRNEELLVAVRLLGKQLESKEQETEGLESAAIDEAREAILSLQGELDSITAKYSAVSKERDLLKSLQGPRGLQTDVQSDATLSEALNNYKKKLTDQDKFIRNLQTETSATIKKLSDRLNETLNAKEELGHRLASTKHTLEINESRLQNTQRLLTNSEKEVEHLTKDCGFWREQASKLENLLVGKSNELRDVERKIQQQAFDNKDLEIAKNSWVLNEESLKREIMQLKADRDQAHSFVFNLQNLLKEREASSIELSEKLSQSIDSFRNLQEKIAEKEDRIQILSSQSEMAMKAQNTKLEQVGELSQKLLDARTRLSELELVIAKLRGELSSVKTHKHISRAVESTLVEPVPKAGILTENEDLREELKLAEAQVIEFSNIAKAAEEALVKATESFDSYREQSDSKIKSLSDLKERLSGEVEDLDKTLAELRSKSYQSESQFMNEIQELKSKVHEYSLKAGSYDTLKSDLESKIISLQGDLSTAVDNNLTIEQRLSLKISELEIEKLETARLNKETSQLREKAESFQKQFEQVKQELDDKSNLLSEAQTAVQEELATAKQQIQDLQYQYNLALNQIEINKSVAGDENDASGELREVINYLRREKDTAEAKVSQLSDELNKLRMLLETATAELNASRSQVSRLQSVKIQLDEAVGEHSKAVEQLAQLNILRESNTTLRNDNRKAHSKIEELESQISALQNAKTETTSQGDSQVSVVQAQELSLLKEENERLKGQLSNNDELQQMMQRFENLKSEFRTKLLAHRNKNRELEKELNEAKAALDASQEKAKGLEAAENSETLGPKLEKLENEKKQSEKQFADEIEKLRKEFDIERNAIKTRLLTEFDVKLKSELAKKSNNGDSANAEKIRKQVEKEKAEEVKKLRNQLATEYEKNLKAKVDEEVAKKISEAPLDAPVDEIRATYEEKIRQLNSDIDARVAKEKEATEKAVDKKYEFKLKVLNRKLEKLEKQKATSQQQPNRGSPAPNSGKSATPAHNGASNDKKRAHATEDGGSNKKTK